VCIKLHTHLKQSPRLLAACICSTARHGDQPHTLYQLCALLLLLPLLLLLLLIQGDTPLPAADAADLLQLVINYGSLTTATTALSRLPSQLEPTAARRLLVTAAVRHPGELATLLAAAPAVQGHLDAPTMSVLLRLLLPRASSMLDCEAIIWLLREQRAVAQQMECAAPEEVLRAAAKGRAVWMSVFTFPLLELIHVQQLEGDVVLEWMRPVSPAGEALAGLGPLRATSPLSGSGVQSDFAGHLGAMRERCMGRGRPPAPAP
jgi:hypothetical protein